MMTMIDAAAMLVREARQRAALSQRELALRAGTAQSVVARIESGSASPSLDTLASILEAAGFEIEARLVPRAPADPVIDAYKPGIDRTLLIENLRRSVDDRLRINADVQYVTDEMRRSRRIAEQAP